jgi:SAM-dependent methyltransferase
MLDLQFYKKIIYMLRSEKRLLFQCNICGNRCDQSLEFLGRETPSCPNCGSTVRMRSIIHVLSKEIFGESLILSKFPKRKGIRGIGMSDWNVYAQELEKKFSYTNTYYHKEPRLDITKFDSELEGSLDFLVSSDVFEHVVPDISIAFTNAYRILKPNGVFVFSVPYKKNGSIEEHFPELHDYTIESANNKIILRNRTKDGRQQLFEDLKFHGGDGLTLEMRFFSRNSLLECFARAGFTNVKIYSDSFLKYGIYWKGIEEGLPIAAEKA